MEPRCNHLGNACERACSIQSLPSPQWSPGVITWETRYARAFFWHADGPQWSPGVITWETQDALNCPSTIEVPQWSPGVITWETRIRLAR